MLNKNLKKAFIDQIMLGFFLIATTTTFVATVSDELKVRNKFYNINNLTVNTSKALASHYMQNNDMVSAEANANNLLNQTTLGKEIIDNNLITYIWRDLDNDAQPDAVTVLVDGYKENTFWYKLLGLNEFNVPSTEASAYTTKDNSTLVSFTVRYLGSSAGYNNIVGSYEFDENGCIINPKLLIINQNDSSKYQYGTEVGTIPEGSRFFMISDGDRVFNDVNFQSEIEISNGCSDDNDDPTDNEKPTVTIDGRTNDSNNREQIFFQDADFSIDNIDHMHEVAKTNFIDYLSYVGSYNGDGNAWESWKDYAVQNNIDYNNDPNDEYYVGIEDLSLNRNDNRNGYNYDGDFDDIMLDTTKHRIPNIVKKTDIQDGLIIREQ